MDERELSNILVSRGAEAPCPACGADNWTALKQRDLDLAIPGEYPDGRKVVGLPVVPVVCLKCGFVRLHSRDVLTNEPYLSPPSEPEETA
jgi:hypothetical protein